MITLSNVSWYQAPRNYAVTPNLIRPDIEYLELMTGGTVHYEIDGELKPVHYGALFWHIPGDYTVYQSDPSDPYECVVFTFRHPGITDRHTQRLTYWNDRKAACMFGREMLAAFHSERYDRSILCDYAYHRLRWHAHQAPLRVEEPDAPDQLRPLIDYAAANPSRDLSVKEMAQMCRISVPHLHALCKDHLSRSPHQYLLRRRLQHARHLLVSTDTPVKELSTRCGFQNIETFYRCFKKQFNVSPAAFRRSHRPY
jgi:AraC-like DNA-binding protein